MTEIDRQIKHPELRFGYVAELYYSCLSEPLPKQLDLIQEWFPFLLISEEEGDENRKIEAEYIDTEYRIHAYRYSGGLYAGGSRRISQITGRLIGTAKGNQEKERKTAELIRRHLARLMVNDGEILLYLKQNVLDKLTRMTEEQLIDFFRQLLDFIFAVANKRESMTEYDADSEPFPMDDESFDMVLYNAAYQYSLDDAEGVINAYLWLLLGGLMRNEIGRVTRIYDSSFAPAYRQSGETNALTEKLHYLFFPEEYESVYYGDDFDSRFPDVIWKCDGCGDILNRQDGFDDHLPVWQCRKCGYLNEISAEQIFSSEEDFKNQVRPEDEKSMCEAIERRRKELGK